MNKFLRKFFVALVIVFIFVQVGFTANEEDAKLIKKILKDIQLTTRVKVEYDDNVFLVEDNEESVVKEVLSQSFLYRLINDKSFFRWNYTGQFAYYNDETTSVTSHSTGFMYSYRPLKKLAFGLQYDYNWLKDSKITSTIGDRVVDLGYHHHRPEVEIKYEIQPRTNIRVNAGVEDLDVTDADSDDFIDNKKRTATLEVNHIFTDLDKLMGFAGMDFRQITFPQISQKASTAYRPYIGISKTFSGIGIWRSEVGFDHINMDELNSDDDNIDFKLSFETIFSLYTKLRFSLNGNVKKSSLRSDYTQYAANIAKMNISHAVSQKTSIFVDYSFEKQHFESSDFTIGSERIDRQTYIQRLNLTLNHKLRKGLSVDYQYGYTKRDSDFAREGYTDNKFSIALTARY